MNLVLSHAQQTAPEQPDRQARDISEETDILPMERKGEHPRRNLSVHRHLGGMGNMGP